MKIGVYVGSFNPVHIGHIKIVNELINKKILDRIIIIPTQNYWEKQNLIPLNHRVNMLRLIENENIEINDKYSNFEYTYQIMNELKNKYLNDELYLIIGADLLPEFHLWKNVIELLENKILVINRDNINVNDYINNFKNKNNFTVVNDIEQIDISSTRIRENINNASGYLDNKIYKYIKDNKIYK